MHVAAHAVALLSLQGNALDDLARGTPEDGVLAKDLREESLKLRVLHRIRLSGAHSAYKPSMLHPAHVAAGDRDHVGSRFYAVLGRVQGHHD
jgi:hypothetical protein